MKKIGIYPGSFQPSHRGHFAAYKQLKQLTLTDTYVITTDKNPTPEAPLNFGEKEQVWVKYGVPASHIVKVNDWKHPQELYQRFSVSQTVAIFALNQKEAADIIKHKEIPPADDAADEVAEVWVGSDHQPLYFQPYKGNEHKMESLDKHAYVIIIEDNIIDGKPISTANIRDVIGSSKKYNTEQKKKFFIWTFGWFDIGLYQMLSDKFKYAHTVATPEEPMVSTPQPIIPSTKLKEIVNSIMNELAPSPVSTPSSPSDSNAADSNANNSMAKTNSKIDLVKQKKELEAKAKSNKQQADSYKTTAKNYDSFQKKTDRDAISAVNKQLSQNN